jgi:hypothetical protein
VVLALEGRDRSWLGEKRRTLTPLGLGYPPPRVFLQKSPEVADSKADDFFGDDKEPAIV